MPRRPIAPVVLSLLAAVLLVGGVAIVWPGGDGEATGRPAVTAPSGPSWAQPSAEEVAALPTEGCASVRYTPPDASVPHDADLCRPDVADGRAVVLIHGGGGYSGSRDGLEPWARWYRDRGFVTLAIDYTLVGDGTPAPVYPAPERDTKAATQYLRRFSEALAIDPESILVHGSSAGARLAAQVLVSSGDPWFDSPDLWPGVPEHVNAMVGFYGYYDGTSLVDDEYFGGGPDDPDPAVVERRDHADSIARAGAASGPALLFHGDVDGLVDVSQTERFGRALNEAGTAVRTRILVDENHAFDQRPGDPFTDIGRTAAAEIDRWLSETAPLGG